MTLHVFITVGTTRFDELVTEILCNKEVFTSRQAVVRLQLGKSELDRTLIGTSWDTYAYKPSLKEDMEWADVIISHAGSGSIIESLRMNKPCLVVINEKLMDNHQRDLACELDKLNYLMACTIKEFKSCLIDFIEKRVTLKPFPKARPDQFLRVLNDLVHIEENPSEAASNELVKS